jgi:alpha-1,3-rhamnosyl/mannosyltransferase
MTSGIEKSVRKADRIITDSCYIRQELIEKFGVDDKIVTSVPLAADDRYRVRTQQECRAVLKSFSLEFQKYLLVIGSVEPRKNLITLIDAYSRLPADIKDEYPLIHIGPSGWNNSAIKAKAEELQRSGHFRSLGYVADAHLPVVYSAAAGFAFPSVYEGFGLPIVEAMSSGIPVLASNASCLPELVGDAGILVDPFSEDSLLEGLRSLLTSGARSSKLVAEGLLRAKSYTWNRTALETLAVYEEAAHG